VNWGGLGRVTRTYALQAYQRGESNRKKEGNETSAHSISLLVRLSRDWVAPIYAFFEPLPFISEIGGRHAHEFRCTAPSCKGRGKTPRIVRHYLDIEDRNSSENLRKHARVCWGVDNLRGADACGNQNAT
jgi:hypothetical protein